MVKRATIRTPKYKHPPVVETVLGVQFPKLAGFRSSHFGLYWREIREQYPTCEDKPPLGEMVELFPRNPMAFKPGISFADAPAPNRVWFTAESKKELLQIQPNRFLSNWRRTEPDEEYSGYEASSAKFLEEFDRFRTFCTGQDGIDEPRPNLCEVTYVNHIQPVQDESAIELFGRVFAGLQWGNAGDWLPVPENTTFNRVFVIEREGRKVGRLYAESALAFQQGDEGPKEFVLLRMIARVLHRPDDGTSLADSMRLAHDWVVNGFASLTDNDIQNERWERQR